MRWLDLPPVWLFGCLLVTWLSPWRVPWGAVALPGMLIVLVGILLTFAALVEFRRAKTTVIPRQAPDALITSGIFRYSRNPIYLSDVLILLGFALMWGKVVGFLLVPLFALMLDKRFIRGEEVRLRDAFGAGFEAYAAKTRRWI